MFRSNHSTSKVLDKITEDVPPIVNNFIGKKCIFEVKVTYFNRYGRDGHTLARIFDIIDSTSITDSSTPADEADPSKKQKVP